MKAVWSNFANRVLELNRLAILLMSALIFFAGVTFAQDEEDEELEEVDFSFNKTVVPLVRVIANPEKYDGKLITVGGYYHSETHLSAVFLDKDSCLYIDTENSILLDQSQAKKDYVHCNKIEVQGKLNHTRKYYGFRYKSDMYLKNTKFKNFVYESKER